MSFVIPEPATARTSVRRLPTGDNPYVPAPARIMQVRELTPDVRLYDLRFTDPGLAEKFNWRPGQFVMLSVLGVGEAPFSLPSSPTRRGTFQLGIRRAGAMTGYLFDHIAEGDLVGVRGPLGHGFPVERFEGQHVLMVAGGLGMVPLRGPPAVRDRSARPLRPRHPSLRGAHAGPGPLPGGTGVARRGAATRRSA